MTESCILAQKVMSRIHKNNEDLATDFRRAGGFRGLFDSLSEEWHYITLPAKVALLRRLVNAGIPIRELMYATIELLTHSGHSLADANHALVYASSEYCNMLLPKA